MVTLPQRVLQAPRRPVSRVITPKTSSKELKFAILLVIEKHITINCQQGVWLSRDHSALWEEDC
jgi:hypothetical protein